MNGKHWYPYVGMFCAALIVSACSDDDNDNDNDEAQQSATLSCDDSLKTAFNPDSNTEVLLVSKFNEGEPLALDGAADPASAPLAPSDLCVVKLNVGPGNPGPEDAPSTSSGIGIEIWLPEKANWNERIHVLGGGGWAGGVHKSLTELAGIGGSTAGAMYLVAGVEGAVSAQTDTGHSDRNASFAMNPDGSINTTLWADFSERAIHEMAVKTKALTTAYYGQDASYAYWDGYSTGGRQGHKEAQINPDDFDGILAGAAAFNWTNFITNELYPQVVIQRDLNGNYLTEDQLALAGNAAIAACDDVGGTDLGYITDLSSCNYNPEQDTDVLCVSAGGTADAANCLTAAQAKAINKMWYGQTSDGTVPDPSTDNGYSPTLASNQRWFGLPRGSKLGWLAGAGPFGTGPFPIASDMVALELQDPSIATPSFVNATGNGQDGWQNLSYAELSDATDKGIALQAEFANINTDDPDLSAFYSGGGKLLAYHGLADELIAPQGSLHYYERVTETLGSEETQSFYRLFMIPGMGHGLRNGTTNPDADPPLPKGLDADGNSQFYDALVDWVENGVEPEEFVLNSMTGNKTGLICAYPAKPVYQSGEATSADSYICE